VRDVCGVEALGVGTSYTIILFNDHRSIEASDPTFRVIYSSQILKYMLVGSSGLDSDSGFDFRFRVFGLQDCREREEGGEIGHRIGEISRWLNDLVC
jgi:hypothetical protein